MLRDDKGNRLFRRVEIRIIYPENIFPPKLIVEKAGPHKGFGPDNIDQILMGISDKLEELYHFWEFQYLELAPEHRTARYVLAFAGYRHNPNAESKALGAETAVSDTTTVAIEAAVDTTLQETAVSALGDRV